MVVVGPAGSGKTELLTQRLLRLLAHVHQPEEILAFTFTRKAAAEMRNRLLNSLQAAERFLADPNADWNALEEHRRLTLQLAAAVLEQNAPPGSSVTRTRLFFTNSRTESGRTTTTVRVRGSWWLYRPEAR